jgi:hypothetical protein
MTQTMRSLAALEALLADNTSGSISPTDLRDALIATVQPGHAEMYISSSGATTLGDTSTWVQVAGTWALTDALNWDMNVNGQLRYTGLAEREVNIAAGVSMTAAGNNMVTEWCIAKDGTPLAPSIVQRKIGTGTDVGAASVIAHTDITNGSYLALMCRNTTSATNVTATKANIVVIDFAD